MGMVKVNFDGAFDEVRRLGGIGIIIRDDEGFVLAAQAMCINGVLDSFFAEAYATFYALEFAAEGGFRSMIMEGDALTIIKALKTTKEDLSCISGVIEKTKALFSIFCQISFSHVCRSCNTAAHTFASIGLRSD
ncbi:hypothetical protein PTKIN_Ptkin07bG0265700 [Pterospermum kingtungense]